VTGVRGRLVPGLGRGAEPLPADEVVPVDQPLCLITQAQRSGGTLLLRLLDGHPACDVVPLQLRQVDRLARLRPTEPEEAWRILYDPKLAERYRRGHRQVKGEVLRDEEVFSFQLPPERQRELFDRCAGRRQARRPRDLADCYFTAFFNAWLDYGNLGPGEKRWLVGFEPGLTRIKGLRRGLGELYPDGRVVSIVRDPWTWYASASRWEPQWREREDALEHWCRSAEGALRWKKLAWDTFLVLSFEDLLARTEETVRRLVAWLGIEFTPELLVPTFNGRPIAANTSFADVATEVSAKPLERADALDADDRAYITERAGELYERLRKLVEDDRAGRPPRAR
jgi:Sulfotransferase family